MGKELLDFCVEKGILIDKKILTLLEDLNNNEIAKNFIERLIYQYKQKVITSSFFENNIYKVYELILNYKGANRKLIESFFINLGINCDFNKLEKSIKEEAVLEFGQDCGVKLLKIYNNKPKKIKVNDFVLNFKYRYNTLKKILQDRPELENLISINRIGEYSSCSVIVIISDKRVTKNGNILLEVEDLTGKTVALINKNRQEIFDKTKELLLDEIVALKCSGSQEMLFVNDIIFPDVKILDKKKSNFEEMAAFISDIHIGSKNFLEKNFNKFIEWINGTVGDKKQREQALKIKYLFIIGDTIDGVGVFPGQEKELVIKDVGSQYKLLADYLFKIRDDVQIILCPGQHDAVRIAEPQPAISEVYGAPLYMLKNLKLVTNPSLIEIGKDIKFKVLMYHGASMHGIIGEIEKLRLGKGHDSPTEVVKYILKKRHLAPTHSLVTYTPIEGEDALLIKETPDIVATGDLHRTEVSDYNGVLLIASSCWQARTPFEEKVGNNPDPCKVPVLNLKTREVKIMDFSDVPGSKLINGVVVKDAD
ncbi:MAG: metallophosphoesterase [Candidatus Pacearchaeota archaeon]